MRSQMPFLLIVFALALKVCSTSSLMLFNQLLHPV